MAPRPFTVPHGRSWLWPSLLASLVVVVVSAGAVAAMETDTYAEAAADVASPQDRAIG